MTELIKDLSFRLEKINKKKEKLFDILYNSDFKNEDLFIIENNNKIFNGDFLNFMDSLIKNMLILDYDVEYHDDKNKNLSMPPDYMKKLFGDDWNLFPNYVYIGYSVSDVEESVICEITQHLNPLFDHIVSNYINNISYKYIWHNTGITRLTPKFYQYWQLII